MADRTSADDKIVDQGNGSGVTSTKACEIGEWAEAYKRDGVGILVDQFRNNFLTRRLVLAAGGLEIASSQAIIAVQNIIIYHRRIIGSSRFSNPWVARWVEFSDDSGYVRGGLRCFDSASGSRDREHFQSGVKQSHGNRHGIVDSWITVDNNLACHHYSLSFQGWYDDPEIDGR
jgi:hypothetical protein